MAAATRRPRRLAVAWLAIVLLASVVDPSGVLPAQGANGSAGGGLAIGLDTWLHLGAYSVLAWLLAAAFDASGPRRGAALLAVVVAFAVGVGVEIIQAPIAARTASIADAVANAVGAVVGVAARTAWERVVGASPSEG
ncbi:VanZ family protein [Halobellus rubicundus]|uniref:VanZ family protein n=1 Tax=Halobellus rubicundus TaxID=2996466 RepID=A0ABD5MCL9_9EURY